MTSLDNELMLFQANKNNELCIFLQHHPQPQPPPPTPTPHPHPPPPTPHPHSI